MTFLFPAAWGLALLAGPIIALYLLKTRQRRRPVSTMLFWRQIKPKIENSPFWRKLRRWLSLLLQLLILALLVAALAHPAFDWERKTAQRIVAILDPSASMGANHPAPGRWPEARDALQSSISRLRVLDEMAIITAEDPPHILSGWSSSKRTLRDALDRASLRPTATDPRAAFALAQELSALRENTRIAVFSDAVWPQPAPARLALDLRGVDAAPPKNAGLTIFAARRSPVAPGEWQLDAEAASADAFTGTLKLSRNGQAMDLVTVESAPGRPWRKSWRGSADGAVAFEAELQPAAGDMLASDNQARCELAALRPLRVVVIGPANPFLDAVLESIPLVQWQRRNQPPSSGQDVDLFIVSNASASLARPDAPVLLIDPTANGFWGERVGPLASSPITDVDRKSPLFSQTGLGAVVIDEAGDWKPAPGAAVFASSLGHPLIFGQWNGRARWMALGFDPSKSDLPLRTAFPIMMGNLLQSLRDQTDEKNAALLPGPVESALRPLATPAPAARSDLRGPAFPAWWLVLFAGLGLLVAEWFLYNRRITD